MSSREWSTYQFGESSPGRPPEHPSVMNGRSPVGQTCSYEGCERINLGGGQFCTSHTGLNKSVEPWPHSLSGPNDFKESVRSKPGKSLNAKSTMRKTAQSDWRSNAAAAVAHSITVATIPRPGSHGINGKIADAPSPANTEPPLKRRKVHDNPVQPPSGNTQNNTGPHLVTRWTAINTQKHLPADAQKIKPASGGGHTQQRPEQLIKSAQHNTLNGTGQPQNRAVDFTTSKSTDAQRLPPPPPQQHGFREHTLKTQRTVVGEANLHVTTEKHSASPMPLAPARHPHSPLSPKHSDAVFVPVTSGTYATNAYPQTHAETRLLQPRPAEAPQSPFLKTCLTSSHQPRRNQPTQPPGITREQGIVRGTDVNGSHGWQSQSPQTPAPVVFHGHPSSATSSLQSSQISTAIQSPHVNGNIAAYATSPQRRNLSEDPHSRIRASTDRLRQTETPPVTDSSVQTPEPMSSWLENWKQKNVTPRVAKSGGRRAEPGTASPARHTTHTNGRSNPRKRPSTGSRPNTSVRKSLHEIIDLTQDESDEPEWPPAHRTAGTDISTASYRDPGVPYLDSTRFEPREPERHPSIASPTRPTTTTSTCPNIAHDMSTASYRDPGIPYPDLTRLESERPPARSITAPDTSTANRKNPSGPYPNSTQFKLWEPDRPSVRPPVVTDMSTASYRDPGVPYPDSTQSRLREPKLTPAPPAIAMPARPTVAAAAHPLIANNVSTVSYKDPGVPHPEPTQVEPKKSDRPEPQPVRLAVATTMSVDSYNDPFPDLSILLALDERRRASSKGTTQPKGSDHAFTNATSSWVHQRQNAEPIAQPRNLAPGDTPELREQTSHMGQVNGDPVQPARPPVLGSENSLAMGGISLTNPDSRPTASLGLGKDSMPCRENTRSPSIVNTDAPPAVPVHEASQDLRVVTTDNIAPGHEFTGGESRSPAKEKESLHDQPGELSRRRYREAAVRATFYLHGADKLDQYIYSAANQMNRPDAPKSSLPAHTLTSGPIRAATQWGYYDPRVHWTWERPAEWYQRKMQEIAQRGNRKSKERFGRAALSLAKRISGTRRAELPERVRRNSVWAAAVEEIRQMEEQGRRRQRDEARRNGKGKEKEGDPETGNANHDGDDDYEVMMGGVWRTISRRANSAGHTA